MDEIFKVRVVRVYNDVGLLGIEQLAFFINNDNAPKLLKRKKSIEIMVENYYFGNRTIRGLEIR